MSLLTCSRYDIIHLELKVGHVDELHRLEVRIMAPIGG